MEYLGISTVTFVWASTAWQLRRELGSSPHARSSRSSSLSSSSFSDLNPSRTMTWQVVQAQLRSQACSMLILLSSKASQIEVPAGALISAPCGQYSGWGSILIIGIWYGLNRLDILAGQGVFDS